MSLKFDHKGSFDDKAALVQVMAWCWTGTKPLPVPMITQFTYSCIWPLGLNELKFMTHSVMFTIWFPMKLTLFIDHDLKRPIYHDPNDDHDH